MRKHPGRPGRRVDMRTASTLRGGVLALATAMAAAAAASMDPGAAPPKAALTAAQIVDGNAAARGGLEAWRKVQTLVWLGHIQSPHGPMPSLPFTMVQKRPNKTHFEINAMGQKTLRVFDGVAGWKLRANSDGSPDIRPFTAQEARFARDGQGIDGPLIDCVAKGNTIELEATEAVEGHDAYRLDVRLSSGQDEHVWVDTHSLLEVKSDRTGYGANGAPSGTVATYYRDYKEFGGLKIATVIETGVGSGQGTDRMVIERVVINPPVDDHAFTRAAIDRRKHGLAQAATGGVGEHPAPAAATMPAAAGADPGAAAR